MKFVADMPISWQTVDMLRTLGYDTIHLSDLGMAGAEDIDILAFARKEGRVILTMDLDFGTLLAQSGDE